MQLQTGTKLQYEISLELQTGTKLQYEISLELQTGTKLQYEISCNCNGGDMKFVQNSKLQKKNTFKIYECIRTKRIYAFFMGCIV